MTRRASPEERLHRAVAAYLRLALRPPTIWTTFPAGGGGKARGGRLKAMGLQPGWPDLLVMHPMTVRGPAGPFLIGSRGAGIELKSDGGRLSAEQVSVRAAFLDAGMSYFVARSVDDVEQALRLAGIPLHATTMARAA